MPRAFLICKKRKAEEAAAAAAAAAADGKDLQPVTKCTKLDIKRAAGAVLSVTAFLDKPSKSQDDSNASLILNEEDLCTGAGSGSQQVLGAGSHLKADDRLSLGTPSPASTLDSEAPPQLDGLPTPPPMMAARGTGMELLPDSWRMRCSPGSPTLMSRFQHQEDWALIQRQRQASYLNHYPFLMALNPYRVAAEPPMTPPGPGSFSPNDARCTAFLPIPPPGRTPPHHGDALPTDPPRFTDNMYHFSPDNKRDFLERGDKDFGQLSPMSEAENLPLDLAMAKTPEKNPRSLPPRFQCEACNKSYATFNGLSKHKEFHCASHVKKEFACKYCEKTYTSMGALKMHIRTHTLPCKCKLCGKSFSRPWLLQGHVRTHTGEKPFNCDHCGRSFADRSNLRAHLQTHSDIKKYNCKQCGKSFSRMSLLLKHQDNSCLGVVIN